MEVAVDDEHGAVVGELATVVGRAEESEQPALRKVLSAARVRARARAGVRVGVGVRVANLRKVLEAVVDALVRAYDQLEAVGVTEGAHAVGAVLHGVGAARVGQHALEAVAVRGVGPEDVVEQPADTAGGAHVDLGGRGEGVARAWRGVLGVVSTVSSVLVVCVVCAWRVWHVWWAW